MYIPTFNEESDPAALHDFIERYPLGAWVSPGPDRLDANHIPFLIDRTRGEYGTLTGHVARANPVWKTIAAGTESLVIFQGPQAYITPNWYPSKRVESAVVPTWNYSVVHAYGAPRAIEDKGWLREHVARLTEVHEAGQTSPWSLSDAPPVFIERMLNGIVGIEITISRLVGKWKVSQNRSDADKQGVIDGLRAGGDGPMAELVERYRRQR